jgi:diaminopimelate decarboxylase
MALADTRPALDPFELTSGLDAGDLVRRFGSPLCVILEPLIRDRYQRLYGALNEEGVPAQIAYSVKTNYLTAVCRVFEQEGAFAEIVSGVEHVIVGRAGFPDDRIVFNGPYKTRDELAALAGRGRINVESLSELDVLESIGRERDAVLSAGLRINLPIGVVPWSRFGFSLSEGEAREAVEHIKRLPHIRLGGLHTHIGTNLTNLEAFAEATRLMCECAHSLISEGEEIEYLDLGGGFAAPRSRLLDIPEESWSVPALEDYGRTISTVFRRYFPSEPAPLLFVEPGRAMVSESGVVLTTVVSKRNVGGRLSVVLDGGINIVPSAQGIKHEVRNLSRTDGPAVPVDVYGPMCMQVDTLGAGVALVEPQTGDVLGVFDTGAYDFAHSIQFIRLRPAVAAVNDAGDARLVRRPEAPSDILAVDTE